MVMEEITEEPGALVERVAALDIGKATLTVCIRVPHEDKPGARRQEVRTCATLTPALLELRDWLICQGVTLVVMEATSAYWKPPFYLLEDDIECWVVNARDVKNVPGRPKTDLLTELRGEVPQVSGQIASRVATFADHGHGRGSAAGSVAAGGAFARVA
jgi:transposase